MWHPNSRHLDGRPQHRPSGWPWNATQDWLLSDFHWEFEMLVFQFHHYVKLEFVDAYRKAILENARETIQEEGVLRFDVFQDQEDPTHFSLLEIYKDQAGRDFHLQTGHFLKWKNTVIGQEMFARKGKGDQFEILFPET
jgi:quinol monooxygenase YgiN